MNNNDLKKLNRVELLKMLIDQMKENEELLAEKERLTQMLDTRKIDVQNCGSIAEAALELNGVFQAAEAAAKQYIDNIKAISSESDRVLDDAQQKAKQILSQAEQEAERILAKAQEKADRMVFVARQESNGIREQAMNVWESFIESRSASETGDEIEKKG